MQRHSLNQEEQFVDITSVMVFTVSAFGLGGYSLYSLLGILGL